MAICQFNYYIWPATPMQAENNSAESRKNSWFLSVKVFGLPIYKQDGQVRQGVSDSIDVPASQKSG